MSSRRDTTNWFKTRFSGKAIGERRTHPNKTILRVECLEARLALSGLNLTFVVDNPNYNTTNTYVTFYGGTLSATYDGGKTVALNHSYTISELNGPISLTSYTGGRIYTSYGAGVAGTDPPEATNPAIPSYSVRFDSVEITYSESNPYSVANLTSVAFFAIPMTINTYTSGSQTPVSHLTYNISAEDLTARLANLVSASDRSKVLLQNGGQFLRVLSPYTSTVTSYFASMAPYIAAVEAWQNAGNTSTLIEGLYTSLTSTTPRTTTQNYSFTTTVEADGSLKMVGGGDVVGHNHTILVSAAQIPAGIYLGNVSWTVDGAPGSFNDNDVYAAAVRDVLSGFNLGFMASATIDPNTGVAFGKESSKYWWAATRAFEYLQPNNAYYNQYAQIVSENSDSYSWAFSDRWNHVQASLAGMATMEIVLMADTTEPTGGTTAGLYDSRSGNFYLRNSNTTGQANTTFNYGPAPTTWDALAGDWTGQGKDTAGLYDSITSTFYLKNANTTGMADNQFSYGPAGSGWMPIVGDWTGQGKDTVGLYNPVTSTFYLKNANTTGIADNQFSYGPAGGDWTPIVGDWNGDGVDTVGLYDVTTSTFYLKNANTTGIADITFSYGSAGTSWTPLAGDWNSNGKDTVGLYYPTTSTFYLKNTNTTGYADTTFNYGPANAGWEPIVGNWTGAHALNAADGAVADSDVPRLSEADLQPIVDAALARWAAAGLDAASVARLQQVDVVIGNLSGSLLGLAEDRRIRLDSDAAGHGWFVDSTPRSDEEFASASSGQMRAIDSRAIDRIDLLSVVEHELGHVVGLNDFDALSDNLMSGELGVGVRRNAG
jgi:hypothetical protein